MSKITGDKQELLQVDAAADKEAVEALKEEALIATGGIVVADNNVTVDEGNEGIYEAPDEIPMDEGAAV